VRDDDPRSFAAAIDDVFLHDRTGLRSRARERAEAYDWNQMLPLLLAHYRQLLHDGAGRSGHARSAGRRAVGLPQ
jgi:glycosyltransferase involved in cell wall biosynthesis